MLRWRVLFFLAWLFLAVDLGYLPWVRISYDIIFGRVESYVYTGFAMINYTFGIYLGFFFGFLTLLLFNRAVREGFILYLTILSCISVIGGEIFAFWAFMTRFDFLSHYQIELLYGFWISPIASGVYVAVSLISAIRASKSLYYDTHYAYFT